MEKFKNHTLKKKKKKKKRAKIFLKTTNIIFLDTSNTLLSPDNALMDNYCTSCYYFNNNK